MKPSCKHQLSLSDGRCGCNRDAPAMPEILNAARAAQVLIAQKPGGHRASFVKVRLPYDALCSLLILTNSSAISRMVFRIPQRTQGPAGFQGYCPEAPSISRSATRIRISLVQAAFHKTRLSRLAIPADAYLSEFMQDICRFWHQQGQGPALLPHLCRAELHVSAHGMTCHLAYPDIRLSMQVFHCASKTYNCGS